jgi:formate/nitrite transporter
MKRGAVDYIAKPFDPDHITVAVRRAIAGKQKAREEQLRTADRIARAMSFPTPVLDDNAPKTIAESVAGKVGVGKTTSPWISVLVLGILAGAYIGFGGMLASTVTFDMGQYLGIGFTKFMTGSVFSLGLMLVIIAGAELFTGNNLMISSVMTRDITLGKMLKRWGLVYVANFIGSIIVALLFVGSGLWKTGEGALGARAVSVAYGKVTLDFLPAVLRGIGCNWLVCLAVWMALAARQTIGKIFAIFFPIMGFVALGFEHSVANMYFISTGLFLRAWGGVAAPAGVAADALNWGAFFVKNLIPVTIGNIIGGVVFVGMSYWSAYLRPGQAARR